MIVVFLSLSCVVFIWLIIRTFKTKSILNENQVEILELKLQVQKLKESKGTD
jgi:hypothetical protein